MSTLNSGLVLLGGRLVVRPIRKLIEADFDAATAGDGRVLLLLDREEVSDDALLHYALSHHEPLRARGHFETVDARHDAELVGDLPSAVEVASRWLGDGYTVTVIAVSPVPMKLVASAVLIGTGVSAALAVTTVFDALGEVPTPEDEIPASVFVQKLCGYRAWWAAKELQRREVVQ